MKDAVTYIRDETRISIAINTVMSLAFVVVAFGWGHPVMIWGLGGYVLDFVPQAFMIALMSTLVPGVLAGKALRTARVAPWHGKTRLPRAHWKRGLILAIASAGIAVAGVASVFALLGMTALPPYLALAAKLAFGAGLAALVTPISLRAALVQAHN